MSTEPEKTKLTAESKSSTSKLIKQQSFNQRSSSQRSSSQKSLNQRSSSQRSVTNARRVRNDIHLGDLGDLGDIKSFVDRYVKKIRNSAPIEREASY